MKRFTPYLLVAIDDNLVWGMRDTGSNFTSITEKTAEDLRLFVEPFSGTYMMADGTRREFAGKVNKVKIRIHDFLTVHLKDLRVLPGTFSQVILGADILTQRGPDSQIREVGTQRDGENEICKIEYGPPRNGVELSLKMYYAADDQPTAGGALREVTGALTATGGQTFTIKPKVRSLERQSEDKVRWAQSIQRAWA